MAKKKGNLYGVSNYHKRTPKKRPGRIRKKDGTRGKKDQNVIKAKVVNETLLMITLMYLTFGGDIKLDTFEINISVVVGFITMLKVVENKKKNFI